MKNYELIPLPKPKKGQQNEQPLVEVKRETRPVTTMRMFVDVSLELAEKLKDYAYWERLTQQETLLKAIERFIKDNPTKSRPEVVKSRKRVGRPSKS